MKTNARILVIEDTPDVASLMALALRRIGCEVVVAGDGARGIQLAIEGTFHLITLDVDLPDMNGFEVCRRLKRLAHLRHTPVVFISGRTSEEDRQHGLSLGAVAFLGKPFDLAELLALVFSHTAADRQTGGKPPAQ